MLMKSFLSLIILQEFDFKQYKKPNSGNIFYSY